MAANIESLWAASIPSISKVGSSSAYPSACASFNTSLKSLPFSFMSVRIKLPVPLMIPATDSTLFALSPCSRALMIGIPPATEASKRNRTFFLFASLMSSFPWFPISALLAVIICLPLLIAFSTSSLASPKPPISSRTTSISG